MGKAAYFTCWLLACCVVTQLRTLGQQSGQPTVMTVAGRTISVFELCTALESLPPPQRTGYTLHPALARDWLGPLMAMAEEAKREHLGTPENEKLNEVDRDNALAGELIQAIARDTRPSDAEIEKYYSAHQSDFEEAKVRHILISDSTALASRSKRSPADAKTKADELAAELKRGAEFAALAARESEDPYTKDKGGNLGYVSHHQLEPAVDQVVWALKPEETSASFAGRFGYEIVQVEDKRVQPLSAVRDLIVGKLKAAALEQRQEEIVRGAHIALDPAYADGPLPCQTPVNAFTLKDPSPIR